MFWLLIPNGFNTQNVSTHELAAIFLISSNKQNLCQLNYHHEGGVRYWYIITVEQRKKFEDLFQENNPSICIEHDEILIDPLLFDKHNIKYKKVTQKPNEILILSSGILPQSFTQDEILSESIDFAFMINSIKILFYIIVNYLQIK
ncbi:unnamed protein product [Adineta steineri]|uniref:JmjC domain-containing protein n=1 Tax=Adineta steineri TaxID=433720 RepID=A0A814HX68_9BILA|nr:unnamed protein product [Adineta steineri]CAF3681500.1 unnamed protein product [Adineta steineri]